MVQQFHSLVHPLMNHHPNYFQHLPTISWPNGTYFINHGQNQRFFRPNAMVGCLPSLRRWQSWQGGSDDHPMIIMNSPSESGGFRLFFIGLRENLNRKPMGFYHQIWGFPVKFFP
jgi:hypothetical protein